MVTRPVVAAVVCLGLFLIIQGLIPKAIAIKKSDFDQFMVEDNRPLMRKNYMNMMQRANDKDSYASLENVEIPYENEPYEPDRNPEELSAFIVDYANMIRNDVILLDKSVETRTRKRGNIKVKKYNNQAISDPPCVCKYTEKTEPLGDNVFPKFIKVRNCSIVQQTCELPYVCKETYYDVPILKKKIVSSYKESPDVPDELQYRWMSDKLSVSVGCICTSDYIVKNKQ